MEELVEQAGAKPTEVAIAPDHTPHKVAAGEDEHHEEEEAEGEEHAESEFDPHWWHDPRNVAAAVAVIRDELDQGRTRQRRRPIAPTPTRT